MTDWPIDLESVLNRRSGGPIDGYQCPGDEWMQRVIILSVVAVMTNEQCTEAMIEHVHSQINEHAARASVSGPMKGD